MLVSAHAMKASLELLRPHLVDSDVKSSGRVAIGTVKGDLHDIGKNLVAMMLQGSGFEVDDLGVDVYPERFVEAARDGADVSRCPRSLTTTMTNMQRGRRRDRRRPACASSVRIIVGGAPITQTYCGRDRRRRLREDRVQRGPAWSRVSSASRRPPMAEQPPRVSDRASSPSADAPTSSPGATSSGGGAPQSASSSRPRAAAKAPAGAAASRIVRGERPPVEHRAGGSCPATRSRPGCASPARPMRSGDARIDVPPESLTAAQRLQLEGEDSELDARPAGRRPRRHAGAADLDDLRSDATRLRDALTPFDGRHPDRGCCASFRAPCGAVTGGRAPRCTGPRTRSSASAARRAGARARGRPRHDEARRLPRRPRDRGDARARRAR